MALLALLAVVVLGAALALLAMSNPRPSELKREEATSRALAKAKEALIAYAATYSDTHPNQVPGYLPCPDQAGGNPEGAAETNCGVKDATVIGRLPWRTLGMEPPRDGAGECLWYAVSGTFKNNPKTALMNWDTLGQIEVYGPDGATYLAGAQAENRAAAVIFAPGLALGQERQDDNSPGTICSKDYVPARFLEAATTVASGTLDNASVTGTPGATTRFIAGEKGTAFNDRLLYLTPAEIFAAIEKRPDFAAKLATLPRSAAECLTGYVATNATSGDHRFPWTAPVALLAYADDTDWDDAEASMSGRFPYQVETTKVLVPNTTTSLPPTTINATGCALRAGGVDENWWKNWKDHLFYALSADFKPTSPLPSPEACSTNGCLKVKDVPGQVAVVMFAGKRLAGQSRSTDAAKGSLANYLERTNLSSHPNTSGNSNYEMDVASSVFNDVLHCVRLDGTGTPIAAPCL